MNNSGSTACKSLPLGDRNFITLTIGQGGQKGEVAKRDAKERKEKEKKNKKDKNNKKVKNSWAEAAEAVFPLCMAIRPCGADDATFGKAITFGFYSVPGYTVAMPLPIPPITFYGTCVSTSLWTTLCLPF